MRALILLLGVLMSLNVIAELHHPTNPGLVDPTIVDIPTHMSEKGGADKSLGPKFTPEPIKINPLVSVAPEGDNTQMVYRPKGNSDEFIIFLLVFCVGLAIAVTIAVFVYRKSKVAYSKSQVIYSTSKEIYAKKKEDAEKKRVARLVEDEALKVQVRKEMQSAPATTESVLKEQINEALNRGDSKVAGELLELFKLSQEKRP